MRAGALRAMVYIWSEQLWRPLHGGVPMNRQGADPGYYGAPLLTRVDAESNRILLDHFSGVSQVTIVTKSGTFGSGPYKLLVDQCDGSLPLAQGLLTSTVILGLLDKNGTLVASVVGEPISGRMWCATSETPTSVQVVSYARQHHSLGLFGTEHPVRVWGGNLSLATTVYVDRTRGHQRTGRQILTDDDARGMAELLMKKTGVMIVGSNGLHHALVANGGERVAGCITTAMGGAWDACGALLVEQAGGSVCGFKLLDHAPDDPDETLVLFDRRYLQDIAGIRPLEWDIVVAANNGANMIALTKCVSGFSSAQFIAAGL